MKLAVASSLALAAVASAACSSPTGGVATLVSDIGQIGTDCDSTAAMLNAFTVSDGLEGALLIQSSEGSIETDVSNAISASNALSAANACDSQAIANAITSLVPHITGILTAIVNQAANVASVGVTYLVTGDLSNLQSGTAQLEGSAYSKLDCSVVPQVSSAFSTINSAFSSAMKVYSVAPTAWPAAPASC